MNGLGSPPGETPGPVIEAVVNISEGRDAAKIAALADAARSTGAAVLDIHTDADHNRSVLTLAGRPLEVAPAVEALAAACIELLDIASHTGVHPRLGIIDVVPFVPLGFEDAEPGWMASIDEATAAACALAALGLPVFFYDRMSVASTTLPLLRREAFGRLKPDAGPNIAHPSAGATALGVRGVLVAYNVDVADDLDDARQIASVIRETEGGPPGVRALAMCLESQDRIQVSMNLTRPERIGVAEAWQAILDAGGHPLRGELVGLLPRSVFEATPQDILDASHIDETCTIEFALEDAGL